GGGGPPAGGRTPRGPRRPPRAGAHRGPPPRGGAAPRPAPPRVPRVSRPADRPTGARSRWTTHRGDGEFRLATHRRVRADHPFRGVALSALVEIREVSKAFGGVQAVTRVGLDVSRGEI